MPRKTPLDRVRAICMALPDATERLSHGAPTWFIAGKKTFVTFHNDHHGDGILGLWCAAPPGAEAELVGEEPDRFYVPAYVGHRGWIGVRLDRSPDWSEVAEIIEDAYRAVAPPKYVKLLDAREISRRRVDEALECAAVAHARMHDDEVETDADLVRALLKSQHPQWAELPIERVPSAGTDNAIYRLGDRLAARLPRIHWAVDNVAKEQRWLPILAPQLPLSVPLPIAAGKPEDAFPYPWGVVEWLPGEMATLDLLDDPVEAARELAAFVRALQAVDPAGGPTHGRGLPVRLGDAVLRANVTELRGEVDGDAVLLAWERVLAAPDYDGPAVWFHGDLAYLNLLVRDGRLAAVIDWGTCGVGDPAIDCLPAWSLFDSDARAAYRDALGCDDATWERGKGWALMSVGGITYYRDTNPVLAAEKIHSIEAVLSET